MELIHITNIPDKLTPNFATSELWNTRYGGHIDFDTYKCFPVAQQFIRDYYCKKYGYDIQWEITSVIRPQDADWSPHKDGKAIDSIPLQNVSAIMHDMALEFKNWMNSELVKGILATGVTVILIEAGCLHLSYREDNLNSHPNWDYDNFYIGEWINDGSEYGKNICYA
jgi:hypothetical protein